MARIIKKSFDSADETRPFVDGTGEVRLIDLEGAGVGKATFQPGWRWSEHVKPIAGTSSCQSRHTGYVLAGHMTVRMNDGMEANYDPGDVMLVEPGHDAWIVGQEPCTVLDWTGFVDYAKPKVTQISTDA